MPNWILGPGHLGLGDHSGKLESLSTKWSVQGQKFKHLIAQVDLLPAKIADKTGRLTIDRALTDSTKM